LRHSSLAALDSLAGSYAKTTDILLTRTYVADKAAFLKYADIRTRYLGPEQPASTTVESSKLVGSDFLVEIEAVAAVN
jgi:enamine deaminase RidA (YjgF/YER057c/UK114 family)